MFQYNFHLLSHSGEVMLTAFRQSCDSYVDAVRKGSQWFMEQHDLNINYKSLRVEESNTHEDAFFGTILPHTIVMKDKVQKDKPLQPWELESELELLLGVPFGTDEKPRVTVLALCEQTGLVLRPDVLYRFEPIKGCEKCDAIVKSYEQKVSE